MTRFSTVKKFSTWSGYSESAIRTKILRNVWPENLVWFRAPDNRILIDLKGFDRWVASRAMAGGQRHHSRNNLDSSISDAGSDTNDG